MSINSALRAGVSGLVANSSALAAISDNIANVNTVAYKRNQVNFANVVTAQAVKGQYSAGGVQGITRQFVSQQGLIQASNSATDLAISGDGFFIVTNKGAGLTAADARSFTRQGSFSVDADGYLVNDSKLYLQGWPVQAGGGFDISPSDLTKMTAINVKNLGAAVTPTSNIAVSANLNKNGIVSAAEATYNVAAAATSMAGYAASVAAGTSPPVGSKPDFVIEMNVVDSTGGSRKLAMALQKDDAANPNKWHAEIYTIPATDLDNGGGIAGLFSSGTVAFKSDGSIDFAATSLTNLTAATDSLGNQIGYQFQVAASTAAGLGTAPAWADALGLNTQPITLDLSKVTQYASTSTVNSISQDGAGVGNIVAIEVDEDGIVSAIYDNSQIRTVAKVGVATFPNADGLAQVSGNAYRPTLVAGEFTIKEAGVGGAGKISPSSLEASTVDLSAEFTGLIQTQKAYSASSKIITTADQMLEELINIKR